MTPAVLFICVSIHGTRICGASVTDRFVHWGKDECLNNVMYECVNECEEGEEGNRHQTLTSINWPQSCCKVCLIYTRKYTTGLQLLRWVMHFHYTKAITISRTRILGQKQWKTLESLSYAKHEAHFIARLQHLTVSVASCLWGKTNNIRLCHSIQTRFHVIISLPKIFYFYKCLRICIGCYLTGKGSIAFQCCGWVVFLS